MRQAGARTKIDSFHDRMQSFDFSFLPAHPLDLASKKDPPDWDLLVSWMAVMASGSVSDATRLFRISQAAVSQRTKQLETFFETTQSDRTTRPPRPG